MNLITFNPYLALGIPEVVYIKPESFFGNIEQIKEADLVLFPEYWQVNTLVYGLHKQIFPSINSYHLGHDKVEMTRVLQATFPSHIPLTKIASRSETVIEEIADDFCFPMVAKEVRNSMGKGVFEIKNLSALRTYVENNKVLYIQEKLPIDRDLRVVFVGDQVFAAYWRIAPEGGFHNNISRGGSYSFDAIPLQALHLVKKVADKLGIDHAGFDVAIVEGWPYIIEFNVMFGNEVINQMDLPLKDAIYRYIKKLCDDDPGSTPSPVVPPRAS